MRVHHSMVHGESLTKETAICTSEGCNREFEYYPSNKQGKLCPSCVEEQNLQYSSGNTPRVRVNCERCDQEFEKVRSWFERTDAHYCSRECFLDDYTVPRITLKCNECSKEFEIPEWLAENRKYCSVDCLHGSEEQRDVDCEYCGDLKSVRVSEYHEDRNYYCSQQCYQAYRTEHGHVEAACENCGDELTLKRHRVEAVERVFCNSECRTEWQTCESNPQYVGGLRGYGAGWYRARQQVLVRDEYECQVCGRGIEEIGREPDVHHITPVATFHKHPDYSKSDAHYVANLVSLCRRHHRMVEEERNLLLDRLNSSLLDQLEISNPPGLDDN